MKGNTAPYKPRPRLLELAIACNAFSLPVVCIPFAWAVIAGSNISASVVLLCPAVVLFSTQTKLVKEILAKRLLKQGRHPNRILVELTAKRTDCKEVYSDTGILQIERGNLVFEGVESSFRLPLGEAVARSYFDTDGNYSSLKVDFKSDGLTLSIRQKWNWNEGYRLGDLHEEIKCMELGKTAEAEEPIRPPVSNRVELEPWFPIAACSIFAMGTAAMIVTICRAIFRIETEMGSRVPWTISIIMFTVGLLAVVYMRRIVASDKLASDSNQA